MNLINRTNETMKAIIQTEFGGIQVLKWTERQKPLPTTDEVLIQVKGAGVNPVDWKIREGYLKDMFPHDFPLTMGWDVAGIVKEVGAGVTNVKIGDSVMSYARKGRIGDGAYAEWITLPASQIVATPKNVTITEAAAIPLVSLTAYQAIFDFANLSKGQSILIHAGAGGVGGFAIQLAKWKGANVTSTGRQVNHDYVKSLGADVTIDYTTTPLREKYDVVFDTVGGDTLRNSVANVKDGGTLVSIVDDPNELNLDLTKLAKVGFVFVEPIQTELDFIRNLIESDHIRPLPIQTVKMSDSGFAHELSQCGRQRGKIVLVP